MGRIDEIKKRMAPENSDWYWAYSEGFEKDDVLYLLEKLEAATEALRKISVTMPGSRDNELVLYYERIAKETYEFIIRN